MLDIELVEEPTDTPFDIVSVEEMARHLRLTSKVSSTALWQGLIQDAITDTLDQFEGIGGELNRSIRPCAWRRYMSRFPAGRQTVIQLPFPPLMEVMEVAIGDDSPIETVDPSDYVVRTGTIVGEIEAKSFWPEVTPRARAVSVTYRAGYEVYPPALKRLIKFIAAHQIENTEATVLEQNKTLIDRRVLFAKDDLVKLLRVPSGYDDWNE